ncbi:MAG: metal-dependent hydrolase [Parcubacteria group bacterium]|nr:metal-dependent hydrolase [Parcubacteria group bacterium]
MDVFSHGLWSGAVYKALNIKKKKNFNVWLAAFWGVFPDLFAFTIPFVWLFWNLFTGGMRFADFPRPEESEPPTETRFPIFNLAAHLYNFSHSLLVFSLIFGVFWWIYKQPQWELGAWLLHILIDIPTHSYKFFPTPFLWPVSSWKFNGIIWGTRWFIIANYLLLVIVYIILYIYKRRNQN